MDACEACRENFELADGVDISGLQHLLGFLGFVEIDVNDSMFLYFSSLCY